MMARLAEKQKEALAKKAEEAQTKLLEEERTREERRQVTHPLSIRPVISGLNKTSQLLRLSCHCHLTRFCALCLQECGNMLTQRVGFEMLRCSRTI